MRSSRLVAAVGPECVLGGSDGAVDIGGSPHRNDGNHLFGRRVDDLEVAWRDRINPFAR